MDNDSKDESRKKEARNTRGGQAGNQNARKHGFYSKTLTEEEKEAYEKAKKVDGLNNEIALLRVKLNSALEKDPDNVRLVVEASRALANLLSEGKKLTPSLKKSMAERIADIFINYAGPVTRAAIEKLLLKK